jgi:hypothetical protein
MRKLCEIRNSYRYVFSVIILSLIFVHQIVAGNQPVHEYKTQNHIIVVMDGIRYSEIWGDESRTNIPHLAQDLAPQGVLFTDFNNFGVTKTISSHAALITGFYEELNNSGEEFPGHPSLFQLWLKSSGEMPDKTWIIASKGKLGVLENTADPEWTGKFLPSSNCGKDGLGLEGGHSYDGYRDDGETWQVVQRIFAQDHPRLAIINYKAPDTFDKENPWESYLQAIRETDDYVYKLWSWIQEDSVYRNRTALYITSDHGRHLDGVQTGFLSHGDSCRGCQHINLLALGPDFAAGKVVEDRHELIDIPATIAGMMGIEIPGSRARFMKCLFR